MTQRVGGRLWLLALAIVAGLVLSSCSGDSVDPTEQAFGLPVWNDTGLTAMPLS